MLAEVPYAKYVLLPASWHGRAVTTSTRWELRARIGVGSELHLRAEVADRFWRAGFDHVTSRVEIYDGGGAEVAAVEVTLATKIDLNCT